MSKIVSVRFLLRVLSRADPKKHARPSPQNALPSKDDSARRVRAQLVGPRSVLGYGQDMGY